MIGQAVITVCGIASLWLSQAESREQRRWAPIVGLLAQPFWFAATVSAQQWGMAALTLVYAAGWARGIYTYWIRRSA